MSSHTFCDVEIIGPPSLAVLSISVQFLPYSTFLSNVSHLVPNGDSPKVNRGSLSTPVCCIRPMTQKHIGVRLQCLINFKTTCLIIGVICTSSHFQLEKKFGMYRLQVWQLIFCRKYHVKSRHSSVGEDDGVRRSRHGKHERKRAGEGDRHHQIERVNTNFCCLYAEIDTENDICTCTNKGIS